MESRVEHGEKTETFEDHVKSLKIKTDPPPLPRSRYQISRLKWIPTDDGAVSVDDKYKISYYQGAYIVPGIFC